MSNLIINKDYRSPLSLRETEKAIKMIKDNFENNLANQLNLQRVSAPLFVRKGSGVNDDLNGTERKVTFELLDDNNSVAECLFSLAKWKRQALADYEFKVGEGLYTDMNAIRPDEDCLDNLHSAYVDQWDWEKVVSADQRNVEFLKDTVKKIYDAMKQLQKQVKKEFSQVETMTLPDEITFLHTEDLQAKYPDLDSRARENEATKEFKAVFVIGIGGLLADGKIHDGRAPDYDDWITEASDGKKGLNGDILLWSPVLNRAMEISSMGIRVDKESMIKQLEQRNETHRLDYKWHQRLINGEIPLSIGGGIGQSRVCMYFLNKMHVGEVQASIWPKDMVDQCKQKGVNLL